MEHCDISWASFFLLELMSSEEFEMKRLGYSLAGYAFSNHQEAMMMVQNLITKVFFAVVNGI